MIRRLLKRFSAKLPQVRYPSDLKDSRARNIVSDNFLRITDVPELYFELKESGWRIKIDPYDLLKDRLPREYFQTLAGAVLSYELTQRNGFEIWVEERSLLRWEGWRLSETNYGLVRRTKTVDQHEIDGDKYMQVANKIYKGYWSLRERS